MAVSANLVLRTELECPNRCKFICRRYLAVSHNPAQKTDIYTPSECWPVTLLMRVLLPTDGNPMKPLFPGKLVLTNHA